MKQKIYLITGLMASGKSTVSDLLAKSIEKCVHLRGDVCILLNTTSMYTERYKEWEGFRRSWHCRKIQKFSFSQNAYLLVFGSE